MNYVIIDSGNSRSFPAAHPLLDGRSADGEVAIVLGTGQAAALAQMTGRDTKAAILVELGTESLGVYAGESRGTEGSNLLGFARFRLGDGEPSNLIELVRQPQTPQAAIDAARQVLEGAGFKVALCFDFQGRIIDRLVRPYYNAALRRLDEGLASADDMDLTLRLGLGYPEGPIALLERTGLEHHFDVTQDLFDAYGETPYAPARRARVAKARAQNKGG
jgi:3-hydroxybutyryl-CoA dehydrogenase